MNTPLLVSERLQQVRSQIPEGIELVAVSKFQPVESIEAAYGAGQRLFGESRVKELMEKIPLLPQDISWHFIGHLQTNKVRQLIGNVALIESVDTFKLLNLIDEESKKKGIMTNVLLQLHVAEEETKFGFSEEELRDYFRSGEYRKLSNVRIRGLMAMATNTENTEIVRKDFACAASLFRDIAVNLSPDIKEFKTLSMGMSGDWPLAVEEGSTMVRVGSAIFGSRY